MAWMRRPNKKEESGIALFMVISAMTVLSLLVTEFTYITQVNQRMAFDSLDQIKAFYLAKSGLKLSLLRLKAYQNIKGSLAGISKSTGASPVSKQLLDKIWSFPFMYPLPTNIPGMSTADKDRIEKFQKESSMDGSFTALIESDSRHNLNRVLSPFVPKPSPTPSASASPSQGSSPNPQASATAFNPEEARESLGKILEGIVLEELEKNPEFANDYRDLDINVLMDNLFAWMDRTYVKQTESGSRKQIKPKQAPFYSLSELHMIYPMDDRLFEIFEPHLTVSMTPGINVNEIKEAQLRSLIALGKHKITDEEVKAFFKARDSEEEGKKFESEKDFFELLQKEVAAFQGGTEKTNEFKKELEKRHIRLTTENTTFKITVRSTVNQATKLLEAWVMLTEPETTQKTGGDTAQTTNASQLQSSEESKTKPDIGLKVTYLRIR